MPVSVAVGRFTKSTTAVTLGNTPADQNNAISGLSFTPKIIFLFATGDSNVPEWTNTLRHSMGWTAGTAQNYSIGFGSDHGVTTTNTFRRAQNDYCLCQGSAGSTGGPLVRLKSFNSDGASFTYDRNDSNAWPIFYLAIGGTDITNIKAGSFTAPTTTGNQSITDVGFEPDIVFFMGAHTQPPTIPGDTSVAHQTWFQGVAKSSSAQNVMAQASVDALGSGTPSQSNRAQLTDSCILWYPPGTQDVFDAKATYVGTTTAGTKGFTVNWVDAPASSITNNVFYLAIKGGSWNTGFTNQATAAAPTTTSVTGLNHTPKGLFLYAYGGNAGTNPAFGTLKFSWGAATSSTSRWNVLGADEDAQSTTQTLRAQRDTAVWTGYVINSNPTPSTETADTDARADLASFQSGGFTLDWEVTDTTVRQILYVTVGDNIGFDLVRNIAESISFTEAREFKRFKLQVVNESISYTENRLNFRGRIRKVTEVSNVSDSPRHRRGRIRKPTVEVINNIETKRRLRGIFKLAPLDQIQTQEDKTAVLGKFRRAPLDQIAMSDLQKAIRGRARRAPLEIIQNNETPRRKVQFYEAYVTAAHLPFYYSGGATNTDNALSLGGARSSYIASSASGSGGGFRSEGFESTGFITTAGNSTAVWDVVLQSEALAGDTEYRCFYLRNNHGTLTAYSVKLWIVSNSPKGEIQIAKGSSAVNGTEQGPFLEGTTPADVNFSIANNEANAVVIGDLPPLGHQAVWFRRTIPASTTAHIGATYSLQISYITSFS